MFCDFLTRWPTLKQAQRARKARLSAFFQEHNVRYPHIIERRIQAILAATPLTSDERSSCPIACWSRAWCSSCGCCCKPCSASMREIAELAPTLPDYAVFASFPGAGPVFAPRLLAAFGEQRERYQLADEVQKYTGIAPVTERSGNKCWVHWRLQCPKFLRQTFVEWAALSIPHCYWAKAYYRAAARWRVHHTRWRCARSPSSGSASCIAAGRTARPTTRPRTSTPSSATARRCSLVLKNPDQPLDGLPQGVS